MTASLSSTERVAWFVAGFASGGLVLLGAALLLVARDADR